MTIRIPRFLALSSAMAALLLGLSMLTAPWSLADTPPPPGGQCSTGTTDLGPGSLATPIVTGQVLGNDAYVVTRGLSPTILGVYDMTTKQVVDKVTIPTGGGAWASTIQGNDLYIGTYYVADLYKFDTVTHELTKIASFPNDTYVWDLYTSPDGKIFAGTYPSGSVYEYDPSTGTVTDLGAAVPGQQYVRSVAVDSTTIYAGVGSSAHLIAIDRATGARQNILPASLSTDAFVYSLVVTANYVIAGMYPSGSLVIINKANYSDYRIVHVNGSDTNIDTLAVDGQYVYVHSNPTATNIYRYDLDSGQVTTLPTAVPPDFLPDMYVLNGQLIAFSDPGDIWVYDLATNQLQVTDLQNAGLPGAPELPQATAAQGSQVVYVAGHDGVQVHNLQTGAVSRFAIDGEPKAMTVVGSQLYLAIYTSGAIDRYDPRTKTVQELAVIGDSQIRPRDMHYDAATGQLLIGTQPDYGQLGGALAVFNPKTNAMAVYRNVIDNESVSSVTSLAGVAYLGGEIAGGGGVSPVATEAHLSAFDLKSGHTLWNIVPVPGAAAIRHLVIVGGLIYGTTDKGTLFVVNPKTQTVLTTESIASGDEVALTVKDGVVYGASHNQLVRIDPSSYAIHVVIDGLNAEPQSYPQLVNGTDSCALYTLTGRDLLQVNVQGP